MEHSCDAPRIARLSGGLRDDKATKDEEDGIFAISLVLLTHPARLGAKAKGERRNSI
jgi:hypothetical protein